MHHCSLCLSPTELFTTWKTRTYFRCSTCSLIQVSAADWPSISEETAEYHLHNNDPSDQGYRRFLGRVTNPALTWLNEHHVSTARLLDFGCGPGPTISVVMKENGWFMNNYDPIFFPESQLLEQLYDLIVCTEVVEHFFTPRAAWTELFALLKKTGRLMVMTQVSDKHSCTADFVLWHYIREQSHVSFYHTDTMQWLASEHGLSLEVIDRNVFCFEYA